MSYGFAAKDAQGNVVIDDRSFNYTKIGTGNTNNFSPPSGWSSSNVRGPIPKENDEMIFYEFPVGKTLFSGRANPLAPGVYASENTGFIRARPYFTTVLPDYGIAVFDASGTLTFHTGEPLIVTPNTNNQFIPRNQPAPQIDVPIDQNVTHIALASSIRSIILVSPPFVAVLGVVVERTSATNVRLSTSSLGITTASTVPEYPVSFSFVAARFIP